MFSVRSGITSVGQQLSGGYKLTTAVYLSRRKHN